MGKKNIYWKGFEELNKGSEIVEKLEQNEFAEKLPVGKEDQNENPNRRDFLKYAGFSTAAAAVRKPAYFRKSHLLGLTSC